MLKITNKKEIADTALWTSCLSRAWMFVGVVAYPMLFPSIGIDKGMVGWTIGLVMIVPAIMAAGSYPLINRYIKQHMSPEHLMLLAGLLFGSGLIVLSVVAADYAGVAAFVTVTCLA